VISPRILNEPCDLSILAQFADRLEPRLTEIGTYNLLAVAIRVTPRDASCEIMDYALRDHSAGQPGAAFLSYADEAKDWCSLASLPERKCYLAAIWQSLSNSDQSAFWRYIQERTAA
jgi:hypothetical protein